MPKVRVSYSELHSLGNFSNAKAEASLEMDVEARDVDETFRRLWGRVRGEVKAELERTAREQLRLDELRTESGTEPPY